ncbi:MAG: hypothetical protein KDK65_03925 [Chlamydiia bacterium]|nr:hypothetical protein [Chlamydiia bacterium]
MNYSDFSVRVNELHQHMNDKGYWDSFCHGKSGWFGSTKATKSEVEQATDKLQELIGPIS